MSNETNGCPAPEHCVNPATCRPTTPTPERMTAERIATFLGEIENIAALLQRTWTGGSVSDPVADVLANAAALIRTLTARAEAAEARAETARAEALEEVWRAVDDLDWDGDEDLANHILKRDVQILKVISDLSITAPPPTAVQKETCDRADIVVDRSVNCGWITVHNRKALIDTIRIALDTEARSGGPYLDLPHPRPAPMGER